MQRAEFKNCVLLALEQRGKKIPELAAELGCHPQSIYTLLNGHSQSIRLAVKICLALGLNPQMAYATCGLPSEIITEIEK